MDFSKFNDDDFDLKKWVNAALRSEQNPNTLVMKLQLLMQEVNGSLEESTTNLLSDIPRVVTEIQGLNNEAVLLRNQMNLVKTDINKVQQETVESMSTVVELDKIKDRMLVTEKKLKQADNWCVLNDQIDLLFEEQDLEGISEKLGEMRDALAGLVNLPDYSDRCDRLNNLSNRLEAILSPKLISTFNNDKSEEARLYYKIFSDMGRQGELYNYYHRTHKTNSQKQFNALRTSGSVETWLHGFYSSVLELFHAQLSWTSGIYTEHTSVVLSLITLCLDNADLHNEISNFLSDSQTPVLALKTLLDIAYRFAHSLGKELSDVDVEITDKLGRSIISPYIKHLISLGDKVKSSLLRDVHSLAMRIKKTSSDSVSELHSSTKRVVAHVRDCIPHCLELTNGYTLVDVVSAMEFYFDLLVEKINTFIREMRVAFGVEAGSSKTFQEDHWVGFQSSFKLFQVLGECYTEISGLEQECIEAVKQHVTKGPGLITKLETWLEADPAKYAVNKTLMDSLVEGSRTNLFDKTLELFKKPINNCNKLCVDFVLSHVKSTLHGVHLSEEWVVEEGAVFSPSPLSYITNLGDYLLLLPQQLEPFFAEENIPLDTALRLVDFTQFPGMAQDVEGDAFAWLTCVCQSTMFTIVEMILKIHRLSGAGCKQLTADVAYISNVMGALEVSLSRDVVDISQLLSLPLDKIESAETHTIPKYLRGKISAMRRPPY
ncbi:hypothetical protein ACHWQZ_G006040 [Mnemiopsis leidyi]